MYTYTSEGVVAKVEVGATRQDPRATRHRNPTTRHRSNGPLLIFLLPV